MIRKVGDIVQVKVISYNNKRRLVFSDSLEDHQLCSFEIVAVTKWHVDLDRKSTRLNSSHVSESRMPSSA